MFIFDQRGAIIKAEKQALQQGMEKGQIERAKAIARRLLAQLNDEQIAEITGLAPDAVAALRTERA